MTFTLEGRYAISGSTLKVTCQVPGEDEKTDSSDIQHAIQAVKDKTSALGCAADKLAISGASSGSHLAMLYAYSRAEKSPIPIVLLFQQTGVADFHADCWASADQAAVIVSAGDRAVGPREQHRLARVVDLEIRVQHRRRIRAIFPRSENDEIPAPRERHRWQAPFRGAGRRARGRRRAGRRAGVWRDTSRARCRRLAASR